jgi:lipopolysaccharide/colanic/teichoic acid biosynthesis glycosyltransferase
MDVVGASLLLIIAAPMLAVCAIAIRVRSPGAVVYCQVREGRGTRPFVMFKLRTMYADAEARLHIMLESSVTLREEWSSYRRLRADPRIVGRVGRWLRQSSVDELPQLWNVLRGDMSLVGPRPLELDVAGAFPSEVRRCRASVRPGMTGLWQISGRSDIDIGTLMAIDCQYVETWSLAGDIAILLRTPAAVVSRRGAY